MVVRRGNNNSSTYRGRFNLIPRTGYSPTIFKGPLHIRGDGDEAVWPFAITLPKHVDPASYSGADQKESYLPLQKRDYDLPSTYTLRTSGSTEGFVEYFLTATLSLTGQGHHDMPTSTLPFQVLTLREDPPIADFELRRSSNHKTVSSYRLIPGMEETKLSFSQKMKQSFNTSSVPDFHFNLVVDIPTVLQLDNPMPIPFKLQAVPDWQHTSEVIRDVPQKIKLNWLDLSITEITEIKCEGTFSPHTKQKDSTTSLCVMNSINALGTSLCIPFNEEPPLDVGELINLRLGRSTAGFSRQANSGRNTFTPSFTTFNIRHWHRLHWELRGDIAGERFSFSGAVPLTILTPSDEQGQPTHVSLAGNGPEMGATSGPSMQRNESWIKPPDEDQAPPSFDQVQQEDLKAG
ncbi:hypothetical protein FPOAC2_07321 [Fusarium poae]|uniref:Arrestin-like N-terminal domain-containing protein n=1 Tax=Fusarium poae TaxID=36050 RepID=A0A1B8AZW5_FUSPO|nr:hypothetical protein FPOAC1_007169 [Fusarium poae]KAG8673850.1 hypothetical protein FPOAC1_007169 [Fusarium poae]OBS26027.1 hypothetical protein FPOA_06558 [Fusarium poae]